MRVLFRLLFLFLFVLFSCVNKDLKSDAKSYCDCKNREYNSETTPGECAKLLNALKTKYEYLPEQQEILAVDIAHCLSE